MSSEVEPEHGTPRRHRAFIESRAFSKLATYDSKAASWKDWGFKFENMAAAVVPSSRDTLDWAAQQDTPILNVDDAEAGPDSVEINPQVYVALAELLEGEALDIVQNTTRGAGLEAWRKFVRRFDPQTVGRKRTLLRRIISPGTVKVHELSRAIEQWEERVRSYQSRARENFSDDVRSGTHIHLNLTSLPDYASVRSEIETFLEARQSSSNPDAMGKWQARKAFDGYCNQCWKWGHMEKDCFTKSKSKCGKGKSAGSLDESEKNGPENTSVGGFGLCAFRNHCDDWKWKNVAK